MQFIKKYPKIVKVFSISSLTLGTGWFYYQIGQARTVLGNALDTSILSGANYDEQNQQDFLVIDQDYTFKQTFDELKFYLARRLIHLTNNENQYVRTKAIRQLSRLKLDNWHCNLLLNLIDAKTAVRLARIRDVDQRFFKENPSNYVNYSQEMLVEVMRQLLVDVHMKSQHPCIGYFIAKAFVDPHDVDRLIDHDSAPAELKKFIQSSHNTLSLCLESILHHTSLEKFSRDIVESNGLPVLMEIFKRFKSNMEITATLCRIISNVSCNPDVLDDLFKSGWIGVLAEWMQSDNLRLSVPAAKALANLDRDDISVYKNRLYLLHPVNSDSVKVNVDVVVVHGLLGGVFYTWRQRDKSIETLGLLGKTTSGKESLTQDPCLVCPEKRKRKTNISDPLTKQFIEDWQDHINQNCTCKEFEVVWDDIPENTSNECEELYSCPGHKYDPRKDEDDCYTYCWPKDWLAEDCQNIRIIGVNYDTNLSLWGTICPCENTRTLEERSEELIKQLAKAGLGERPIVWITHSMGGLMVKELLNTAFESKNTNLRNICLNTKGIVFYSTPHIGSSVANMSQASTMVLWPSTEVQELKENSPKLLEIHNKFLDLVQKLPIKVITFIETKSTVLTAMKFKLLLVEPHSGKTGIGEYYEIPQDHLNICKPSSRHSFLYQRVLHLIEEISNNKGEV